MHFSRLYSSSSSFEFGGFGITEPRHRRAVEDNPDGDVLGKVLEMMLCAPGHEHTQRWPSAAASGPPQVRHENLTPITEYFEFCCDLSFLRGVPYSQPGIRFFQHKERCLLNHKCEKQVVSNSNSFKVQERQVTSADDREKYFARCSINPYRSL